MQTIIAPSILSADFAQLATAIEIIDKSVAEFVHIDVMDGRFVPNITFGMPVIKAIRSYTKKTFDVHLMIVEPEKYIMDFKNAGADLLTVHYEASIHLHRTIQVIKNNGMRAGVAINPHTSVSVLSDILEEIDLVCLMSVNPGFGGQSFIERTYEKIEMLKELAYKRNPNLLIEIDGGVNLSNAQKLINCGANVLVAGNAIFNTEYPIETISAFKSVVGKI